MQTALRCLFVNLTLFFLTFSSPASAEDDLLVLREGDYAPSFTAQADSGKLFKLADRVGEKIVVVYFYPADMTGGCTKQACGFRDDLARLASESVEVVGISGDSVRNHQLFKKVYDLNFSLLADEDGAIAKSFGVPLKEGGSITRTIDGNEETLTRGVTAARWTFVIDRDGKIAFKNTEVDAAGDSKAILDIVSELKNKPQAYFRRAGGVAADDAQPLPDALDSKQGFVWRTKVDSGISTPCVYGNRVFMTTHRGTELATVALYRDSGEVRWKRVAPTNTLERFHSTGSPACSTPACDGERLYVFFGSYGLICYDLEGQVLWSKKMGPFQDEFGAASSPILVDDKIILNEDHDVDSFISAIDKTTGATLWRTPREGFTRSYSTPIIWEVDGVKQIIVAGATQLAAYDLNNGQKLWWTNGLSRIVSTTPTLSDGMLYVASWTPGGDAGTRISMGPFDAAIKEYDKDGDGKIARAELPEGAVLSRFFRIDLDQDGGLDEVEWKAHAVVFERAQNALSAIRPGHGESGDLTGKNVVWQYKRSLPSVPSPLVYRDVLYMVKDSGIVTALKAESGELLKQGRASGLGNYYASPVAGDGKVYLASERGTITILKAGEEWEILTYHDFEERIMGTPVISDGQIFVRTDEALYCFAKS